jgi:2-polyprenyl-6-methoxyphenol hydroxylase-like FAD-dependent oxidoreductase
MDETEVLVVGAGPTGLMLGLELRTRAVACRVVDAAPARSPHSRALAVQARTLEVLDRHGLAARLVAAGQRALGNRVIVRGREVARVEIGDIGATGSPYSFVLFVSQVETEQALEGAFERAGGHVERPVELDELDDRQDGGVVARFRGGRTLRARYVVGCDGAHSAVRKAVGVRFEGAAYPEDFILTDTHIAGLDNAGGLTIRLGPPGLTAVFSLREPDLYRIIATRAKDTGEREPELADFADILEQLGDEGVRLFDPRWVTRFRLHHRVADRFAIGRVFLAGDAAHIHSPAGGQGMNTGIQDAFNLGWKLELALAGRARPDVLDSYAAERRPVAVRLLEFTDRLFRLGATTNPVGQLVRDAAIPRLLPLALSSPARRARAFRFISQLGVRYRKSPIVARGSHGLGRARPRPGDRAPDAPLVAPDGSQTSLLARLKHPLHHLLVLSGPVPAAAEPWAPTRERLRRAVRGFEDLVRIEGVTTAPQGGEQLRDAEGTLHERYGARGPALYLIRPDGYVAFRSAGRDAEALVDYLARWYRRRST